ncbi:23S rRNA pseudouridine(2604) synthase RluF [Tenacibaculum finnmarkense]|uniref:23S rRNA pseudouridine(2604) synthase RluF n=1 Tax=Tenacibaculum finnmarkense TaxID=2781243 RepID=UPI001E39BE4C|nr:23S rRNA pseudouridine(2604) synthase RluF [Tenacibaculum finnmarkense]MCD8445527.1 23S rRNA pseudouridine(2604) synthase RluF [Tenacibaculum finnmarkense genomovar ulcerans]MCG8795456.1 23S rRNA pseudouridine(2604) synthase RluF [Tenacibaculum finnmarkense]MCG8797766.1 23S rRNA pseudouridine(2604) synthase RluF [Tenacibaculum finnmarkense]
MENQKNNNKVSVNLNKFISSTGICSRRDAEKYIRSGRVTINKNVAQLGNRVSKGDDVRVDGRRLIVKETILYIALNKPVGIVCTTDSREKDNIVKFVGHPDRLFPIGRLDKPSEGLIFLTNDGDIVNKILRAGNNHEKEYIVSVDKKITDEFIAKMSNGIPILGTVTQKCKVEKITDFIFQITLTQGLNRQIRRMCEYLEYEVTKLKRNRIMNVSLGNLKSGDWRELTEEEMNEINEMISSSSKTEEASDFKSDKLIQSKLAREENQARQARQASKSGQKGQAKQAKKAKKKELVNKKSAAFRKNSPKTIRTVKASAKGKSARRRK